MSANGTATRTEAIDVSMLTPEDRRLVHRFRDWIRAVSAEKGLGSRWECVAAEGKVKVVHRTITVPRERF